MVIFINGTLGVGKSSVAKFLLWSQPKTVVLEGDALCCINPFDAYDKERINALIEIIRFMIEKYQSLGFCRFVVDSIFEKTSEIERVNSILAEIDSDITHYLLLSSVEKRTENIKRRNRENHLWELERSVQLQDLLLSEFQNSKLVNTIDTSGLSVSEVGEYILQGVLREK